MLKQSIALVSLLCGAVGAPAMAGDGTSIPVRPASLLQDEQGSAARAVILHSRDNRVQIDLDEVLPDGGERPSSGVPLTLILPDLSVREAVTNEEGIAEFEGVAPGQVVGVTTTTEDGQHVAVGASTVAAGDANSAPTTLVPYRAPREELLRMAEGHVASAAGPAVIDDLRPVAADSAIAPNFYRVLLTPQGSLEGRVYSLVSPGAPTYGLGNTNIAIFRNGQIIRSTLTEPDGRFVIENLAPGFYGIVAAGQAGYAAFGFHALGSAPLPPLVQARPVSFAQVDGAPMLEVAMLPPQMVPVVIEQIVTSGGLPFPGDVPPGAPFPMAGAPGFGVPPGGMGGGFGGGGAGGALGGGAGLIGLAGAAAAVAAIAADDDDDNFIPAPASPSGAIVVVESESD